MTSLEEVVDPRIAVLIVWSIFFFVFIILPSVCIRCIICCAGGDGIHDDMEDNNDNNNEPIMEDDGWGQYVYVTARKRDRIEELRSNLLHDRCLGRFSIQLKEEHMMCLDENGMDVVVEEDSKDDDAEPSSAPQDIELGCLHEVKEGSKEENNDENNDDGIIHIITQTGQLGIHIEGRPPVVCSINEDSPLLGKLQVGDKIIAIDDEDMQEILPASLICILLVSITGERKITVQRGDVDDEMEESVSNGYTHVRIPFPGYDCEGEKVKEKPPKKGNAINNSNRRFPFFKKKKNKQDEQVEEADKEDEEVVRDKVRDKDERRNVPHFCAVCLGEYDIGQTVSWSSNSECTHVFHKNCIVKWLMTVGRKATRYHTIPNNPTAESLLEFKLECPCCRQTFISDLAIEEDTTKEECVEDGNV